VIVVKVSDYGDLKNSTESLKGGLHNVFTAGWAVNQHCTATSVINNKRRVSLTNIKEAHSDGTILASVHRSAPPAVEAWPSALQAQ
jgi:hypothetical protein